MCQGNRILFRERLSHYGPCDEVPAYTREQIGFSKGEPKLVSQTINACHRCGLSGGKPVAQLAQADQEKGYKIKWHGSFPLKEGVAARAVA